MTKKEFAEELKLRLVGEVEQDTRISVVEVPKNNGVVMVGLSFIKSDSSVSPTIYVEPYYKAFNTGMKMETIVANIFNIYEDAKTVKSVDTGFLHEWDKVKEMVIFKMVNRDLNQGMLESVPHKDVLDLAMVFMVELSQIGGVFVINKTLFDLWEISIDQLEEVAIENTVKKYPYVLKSLSDMLADMVKEDIPDNGWYVLSNENFEYGAAVLFYPDTLKQIADKWDSDLYIIPDCVHQVLICSDDVIGENVAECRETLVRMNEEELASDEVLSGNIYKYDRAEDQLGIVK